MTTAYLNPRASLVRAGEWTYEFAPPTIGATPLLVLNDQDEFGCLWACDVPEGSQAPAAVTVVDDRPYGDGGYAGETTYDARALTFEGTTVCPDERSLQAAMQRLRTVASTRTGLLYTQAGYPPKSLLVRAATGQPKMRALEGQMLEWAFTMVAEDPLWFDASELVAPGRTIGLPGLQVGRVYNRIYNYVYGVGGDTDLQIVNAGDEWAQASYLIKGPVLNPVIVNVATGEFLGILIDLPAGDELLVDTTDELATYNGQAFYLQTAVGSTMPRIAPGSNTLRWSAATSNTTASLTVTTASTWK